MEKLKTYILNTYNLVPAPIYGLLSAVVGLSGDIIAILLFQEYNLNYMISALGAGPGALYFNIGTILSGIFALLFYLHMVKVIGKENADPKLEKVGRFFAINSCIFFSLVGVFPSSRIMIIFVLHGTFALISWLSAIIYLSIFSKLIFKNKVIPKFFGYLALITVGTIIVFLLTWIPLIEWIMAILVTLWITLPSIYMLYRKI
ncbi:MAG: hypothetical protein KGD68_02310 [Candidatus Lokiarchaeota archaeon]|nr:hypothetical protein [Candidatus Lokiarchaeota archaeon]